MDNCVDSYVRNRLADKRSIKLELNREHFIIWDNCGGISKDMFTNQVFRPGAVMGSSNQPTIGMYGIGLKRAMFKLGGHIEFETDDCVNHSRLVLDVNEWTRREDEWKWPVQIGMTTLAPSESGFTKITITNLNKETLETFTEAFKSDFITDAGIYYANFIANRIDIYVNNIKLEGPDLSINTMKGFSPAVLDEKYMGVSIKIICWIAPPEGEGKRLPRLETKGWKIFMNDRLILYNDTSEKTGWRGDDDPLSLPKYHSIDNQFRGMVFLKADDPTKLPINTLKTGFNEESEIYTYLLKNMVITARPLIAYLRKKYDKAKSKLDSFEADIIAKSNMSIEQSKIPVADIAGNQQFIYPRIIGQRQKTVAGISGLHP